MDPFGLLERLQMRPVCEVLRFLYIFVHSAASGKEEEGGRALRVTL